MSAFDAVLSRPGWVVSLTITGRVGRIAECKVHCNFRANGVTSQIGMTVFAVEGVVDLDAVAANVLDTMARIDQAPAQA